MKLQKEIQDGLIKLLINSLLPEGRSRPFAVITTAPGQWLSHSSSESITIIDVTELTGPTLWVTEMVIRDRVLDSVRAAGWPDALVNVEHRTSSIVPDIVLFGRNEEPLAVIEVSHPARLAAASKQARHYAKILKAKFGMASDGTRFLFGEADGNEFEDGDNFPTPQQLGQRFTNGRVSAIGSEHPSRAIVRPTTISQLNGYIDTLGAANIIVDFTFPWNDRDSSVARQVREFLGEIARPFRYLDSLSATLLLVSTIRSIKRLVALLPKGVAFGGIKGTGYFFPLPSQAAV